MQFPSALNWPNDHAPTIPPHLPAAHYQANGLLIEKHPSGSDIEIIAAYFRDHDRNIGAGTFTTKLPGSPAKNA